MPDDGNAVIRPEVIDEGGVGLVSSSLAMAGGVSRDRHDPI